MRECPRCEICYEDDTLICPDDQTKTKSTLPGTTLLNSRYRLSKRLGRGAMGQVYLARDENLITRRVAVKTIRPDVAVEVISPNDRVYDLEEKLEDYRAAGIPLIWLLYPPTRRVRVLRPEGPPTELGPDDELTGEEVLPGFRCRVADLFAGPPRMEPAPQA